ncbi:hypothetical protein PMAYCL1PPCAC_25906, partial [Pristionchus mayeri]
HTKMLERQLKEEQEVRISLQCKAEHTEEFAIHIENEHKKMEVELKRLEKENEIFRNMESGRANLELELANEKAKNEKMEVELRRSENDNQRIREQMKRIEELELEEEKNREAIDEQTKEKFRRNAVALGELKTSNEKHLHKISELEDEKQTLIQSFHALKGAFDDIEQQREVLEAQKRVLKGRIAWYDANWATRRSQYPENNWYYEENHPPPTPNVALAFRPALVVPPGTVFPMPTPQPIPDPDVICLGSTTSNASLISSTTAEVSSPPPPPSLPTPPPAQQSIVQDEVIKLKAEKEKLAKEKSTLIQDLIEARKNISELGNERMKLQRDLEISHERIEGLERLVNNHPFRSHYRQHRDLKEAQERIEELERFEAEKRCDELKNEIEKLNDEGEELFKAKSEAVRELENARKRLEEMERSCELNSMKLGELQAENHRLNERLDNAEKRCDKLKKDMEKLDGEWEDLFKAKSCEFNNMKLGELEAQNRRLHDRLDEAKIRILSLDGEKLKLEQELKKRIYDSNISVSQCKEPKKIEEQHETLKMTERKLQADLSEWNELVLQQSGVFRAKCASSSCSCCPSPSLSSLRSSRHRLSQAHSSADPSTKGFQPCIPEE